MRNHTLRYVKSITPGRKAQVKSYLEKKNTCRQLESVKSIFLQMKTIEVTVRISQEYIHPNEKH